MDTKTAILSRCSCRDYLDDQITDSECDALIEAACAAPAAMGDYSGIKLTVVQSPELWAMIERETAHAMPMTGAHPTYHAPTLFLISVKPNEAFAMIPYCNAACMAENIMIQASALGLSSVYIMAVPTAMQEKPELLKQLGISDGFLPAVMVAVGKSKVAPKGRKSKGIVVEKF